MTRMHASHIIGWTEVSVPNDYNQMFKPSMTTYKMEWNLILKASINLKECQHPWLPLHNWAWKESQITFLMKLNKDCVGKVGWLLLFYDLLMISCELAGYWQGYWQAHCRWLLVASASSSLTRLCCCCCSCFIRFLDVRCTSRTLNLSSPRIDFCLSRPPA